MRSRKDEFRSEEMPINSLGEVGLNEVRSFERYYLTDPQVYSQEGKLMSRWHDLVKSSELEPSNIRRIVFRTFVTERVLNSLVSRVRKVKNLQLETVLPLQEIDVAKGKTYLIMLTQNNHQNQMSVHERKRLEALSKQPTPRVDQGDLYYKKISTLPAGFSLSYTLKPSDSHDLLSLWGHNFEWTLSGIKTFKAEVDAGQKWFCGVRNEKGVLVGACMAEAVLLNDRWLTELTEWAAKVRGVSSKMVIALIAQVLEVLYYESADKQFPYLIAEMNLFNEDAQNLGSPGAGSSAGLRLPRSDNRRIKPSHNVLNHNVLVGDGRHTSGYPNLNNFALGILSKDMLTTSYSQRTTSAITNNIRKNDR